MLNQKVGTHPTVRRDHTLFSPHFEGFTQLEEAGKPLCVKKLLPGLPMTAGMFDLGS